MEFKPYRGEMTENNFLMELDDKEMSIPNFELDPQLLISQVRKQYFSHLLKLLSENYENHQKLGKNVYLPSAIWRCAKSLESNAVQMCMVVELYRKNIFNLIKQLKMDTKKGRLHRPLLKCLQNPSETEKHTQTSKRNRTDTCTCTCSCNTKSTNHNQSIQFTQPNIYMNDSDITMSSYADKREPITEHPGPPQLNGNDSLRNENRISVDSQEEDQMMMQLEELFRDDNNDIEDLLEGVGCNIPLGITAEDSCNNNLQEPIANNMEIDENAVSLNDRLVMLASSGILPQPEPAFMQKDSEIKMQIKPKSRIKKREYRWICEEYYQRLYLLEKLDELREMSRSQHSMVKELFIELFGEDSDDEEVLSPQDDNPDFINGCKERIAPWVVKQLTPYYVKGRIMGKPLFKALAKHLINLIYKCSKYPSEYEVHSFISDFLKSHKLIRCEADFTDFKIDNLYV